MNTRETSEDKLERLKLLVVDDETGMRLAVERALRKFRIPLGQKEKDLSLDVVMAETGEDALEIIEKQEPDLMLLDHKLPGISGLDVLARLAGEGRDMLTVMMTAYASLETAVTATKRGAHDYLAKPFTPNELKSVVSTAAKHLLLQRRARQLAEEKKRVRFEFISVLAHELKAPLAAVEGYLNLMKDRCSGDEISAYENFITRSVSRLDGMRKLIFDLLDMTRIESGEKARNLELLDAVASVKETVATLEPRARENEIEIEINSPKELVVEGDAGELSILFNNLISNGVKYNRKGGHVWISLQEEGKNLIAEVRDDGIGMSTEEAASLFTEFKRIKNEKTKGIEGSGLGLSTVKKLCELYGGSVEVSSKADEGSTFRLKLPMIPSQDHGAVN